MNRGVALSCPLPFADDAQITLAHGGGGRLMHELLDKIFLPAFANPRLAMRHDSAVLPAHTGRWAMTTDSYVIQPLFFPGGDIGSLAVYGTVNDLAMSGARPRYLSCGFILEEGLALSTLARVVAAMAQAAARCAVELVTGDTKVVERGKGDGVFINTAGVGVIDHELVIAPASVRTGDAILLSGDLGRHGIAVMAAREGLAFESALESDCAPLAEPVLAMLQDGVRVHCLRDLTRGGLASALVEIAAASGWEIAIDESAIAVCDEVRGACEILGLDPLYVANEGRFIALVPAAEAERAAALLRRYEVSRDAQVIGVTRLGKAGRVLLRTPLGTERIVDMLSGTQLPRIC